MANKAQKNSRETLMQQVAGSRHFLLLILVFTLVNLVMVVLDANTYFLFSASLPYYMTLYAKGMDNGFAYGDWDINGTYTITALAISAVILLLFLLCWLLSKKRHGWLCAALVLFALDTAALALCTFTIVTEPASNIVDFIFHAWTLWSLLQGTIAAGKLKKLPPEQAVANPEDFLSIRPDINSEEYIP